jgi:hypothetical protein
MIRVTLLKPFCTQPLSPTQYGRVHVTYSTPSVCQQFGMCLSGKHFSRARSIQKETIDEQSGRLVTTASHQRICPLSNHHLHIQGSSSNLTSAADGGAIFFVAPINKNLTLVVPGPHGTPTTSHRRGAGTTTFCPFSKKLKTKSSAGASIQG